MELFRECFLRGNFIFTGRVEFKICFVSQLIEKEEFLLLGAFYDLVTFFLGCYSVEEEKEVCLISA